MTRCHGTNATGYTLGPNVVRDRTLMNTEQIGILLQKIVETMSLPKSPTCTRQSRAVLLAVERWLGDARLPDDIAQYLQTLAAWGDMMKPGILASSASADLPEDKKAGVLSYVQWIFTSPDWDALQQLAKADARTPMKLVKPATVIKH